MPHNEERDERETNGLDEVEGKRIVSYLFSYDFGYCLIAAYHHRLHIAFVRHFGRPFTLPYHRISSHGYPSLLWEIGCIAWVCGIGRCL